MDDPDVVMEFEWNGKGLITQVSYKACTRADEGRSAIEFCSMISDIMRPRDTVIDVKVDVHLGK